MVLILLSWLYILFTSVSLGISFSKLFRITSCEIVITSILGLFSVAIAASTWAFFGPINISFHVFLFLLSLLLTLKNKIHFVTIFQKVQEHFLTFPFSIKIILLLNSLLILAQSATFPFIIDNETYYIQTIKWLNEYGFVPGLANLHLFFGQTSGWHIVQSVYSFSFVFDSFNDLNGFCLLIGNYWAFQKLHSYFETKNRLDLLYGLLPLTYIFMFQFVSSPSPDLPVYIFSFILFSLYLDSTFENLKYTFIQVTLIALCVVYIKITAIVVVLIPMVLLFKNYTILKKHLVKITVVSVVVFSLLIAKNILLTGYPLFPLTVLPFPGLDYSVPNEIMTYFFSKSMLHSFYMPFGSFEDYSFLDILKQYFLHSGIDSVFAIITVVLLVISPFVLTKYSSKNKLWVIYFSFILLLINLIFSSPQYRFYIYYTIFFCLLFLSFLITKRKFIMVLLCLNMLCLMLIMSTLIIRMHN